VQDVELQLCHGALRPGQAFAEHEDLVRGGVDGGARRVRLRSRRVDRHHVEALAADLFYEALGQFGDGVLAEILRQEAHADPLARHSAARLPACQRRSDKVQHWAHPAKQPAGRFHQRPIVLAVIGEIEEPSAELLHRIVDRAERFRRMPQCFEQAAAKRLSFRGARTDRRQARAGAQQEPVFVGAARKFAVEPQCSFGEAAAVLQQRPESEAGVGVVGPERQRPLGAGHRLVEATLVLEHGGEVELGLGVVGLDR